MQIEELAPFVYEDVTYRRRFVDTGTRNDIGHNLTELRAASDAVGNDPDENTNSVGFERHPDWMGHLHRYAYTGRVIDKLQPKSILDVGCGDLQLTFYLNKNRYRPPQDCVYYGLELRATAAWLNSLTPAGGPKHRYKADMHLVKCDIVRDDLAQIPDFPGQFDLVVSYETAEHVPTAFQQEFINRLFQWTKPGGTCLFSTPNGGVSVSCAENHHDPVTGEEREIPYAKKLEMVRQAGFEFVEAFGTFSASKYLPEEVRNHYKTDPSWKRMKEWYDTSLYNCLIAVNNPEHSNNALMVLKRP
jgi:SAM-dependent methyltransferase